MAKKREIKVECGCGMWIGPSGLRMHEASNYHRAWVEGVEPAAFKKEETGLPDSKEPVAVSPSTPPLHPNLQAAIDAWVDGPRHQARMVRSAFAALRWPNKEHPGSVRDFLIEHNIPVLDTPKKVTDGQMRTYATQWEKEQLEEPVNA